MGICRSVGETTRVGGESKTKELKMAHLGDLKLVKAHATPAPARHALQFVFDGRAGALVGSKTVPLVDT